MSLPRYEPMLAAPWPQAFSDPNWLFDVKWDGVRVLLYWDGRRVELRSRRGRDVTATYPELGGFSSGRPCVLDGELVALDPKGAPSFQLLQGRMNLTGTQQVAEVSRSSPVAFMVFDLLYEGEELIHEPLRARLARLDRYSLQPPCLRSASVVGDGEMLFDVAGEHGLEGVVAKRLISPYRPGARSLDWRKVARVARGRGVVGGFTPGTGGRASTFGSLLLGLWDEGSLRWIGAVGTGFDDRALRFIRGTLDELTRERSPFHPQAELPRQATWVEPRLVAMVEFKQWTGAGRLRAASFQGFTDDPVESVTWEAEGPPSG